MSQPASPEWPFKIIRCNCGSKWIFLNVHLLKKWIAVHTSMWTVQGIVCMNGPQVDHQGSDDIEHDFDQDQIDSNNIL